MDNWNYEYRKLIDRLDQFAHCAQCSAFQQAWNYTKHMMFAHATAIQLPEMNVEEALSLAWSQFEATFDEQDDEAVLALAGLVIHLVNTVPLGQTLAFHTAIEAAFSLARGFSEEDIVQQQALIHESNALGLSNILCPTTITSGMPASFSSHVSSNPSPHPGLTVIQGGKVD